MPRKPTGQVVVKHHQRGKTFALRFRVAGERQYVTLGTEADGWTPARAQQELDDTMARVRLGILRPPARAGGDFGEQAAAAPSPFFRDYAEGWLGDPRHDWAPRTLNAYRWEVREILMPSFGGLRLHEITVRTIDAFTGAMVAERNAGRRLSNESVNKALTRLGSILDQAVEHELIATNPARVNPKNRRLPVTRPEGTRLDTASQIATLLDAAAQLDRDARSDYRCLGRRAMLATLVFGGLRIGELTDLRWRDVDLATGRLCLRGTKTDAAKREVGLLPALRDDLAGHRARTPHSKQSDFVFATTTGNAHGATNIRRRVLARAVELASERLIEEGAAPLPHLTPHSLRRTFASVLFALGYSPPAVQEAMGHTDPKLTLRIYARAMRRTPEEALALRAVTGVEATPPIPLARTRAPLSRGSNEGAFGH